MNKAKYVQEITVTDPDSGEEVSVSIYKDESSGAMLGVDSSYIEQCFDDDEDVVIDSPFDDGTRLELTEGE